MNPILIVSTNMTKKEMESAAWFSALAVLFSCSPWPSSWGPYIKDVRTEGGRGVEKSLNFADE